MKRTPLLPERSSDSTVIFAGLKSPDSEFGLGGSVWTTDLREGERVALQIDSGIVFVNSISKSDPRMPFGGTKQSGIGRELGRYGMMEFINAKGVNVYENV